MKNLGFIAVVALLMVFGCSKDEMITSEQESISVEENNQPAINGNRPGSPHSLSIMQFLGNSNKLEGSLTSDDSKYIIYEKGNFSGKLVGIGKINSKESEYFFTGFEYKDDYKEDDNTVVAYNITGTGKIYLTARDFCTVTISFYLIPNYNPIDGGGNIAKGVLTIINGAGKLEALDDKIFNIYRGGVRYPYGINLATGEIGLRIEENIQRTN